MSIGMRHKGHSFLIFLTVSAHAEQKRACPHGTNAMRSRGTSSQTSHISVAGYVADIDVDVDVDVADATSLSVPSNTLKCPKHVFDIFDIFFFSVVKFQASLRA